MKVAKDIKGQKETEKNKGDSFQLIVFKLGGEEYAIHIDQIKEVVPTPAITKMPQTPAYVKGVANIRGNIIAILDLERKFGMEQSAEAKHEFTLVFESDEFKIGALVKEVPNTLTVFESEVDDSANIIQSSSEQGYISGIVKKEGRLIILIDLSKVVVDVDQGSLKQVVV